jgi:hypothetical protein
VAGPEERKQAGEIKIRSRICDGGQVGVLPEDASKPVHMLVVANASIRPTRSLARRGSRLQPASPPSRD